MELDWYCTGAVGMKNKAAGGFYGFSWGHKWARWKSKEIDSMHLMPHKKHLGKWGCNCQFHIHKMFNPRKHRMVTIQPSDLFYVQCIIIFLPGYLLLLMSIICLSFIRFSSVLFNLLCSTIQCSETRLFSFSKIKYNFTDIPISIS
jgi:hypothetical protein